VSSRQHRSNAGLVKGTTGRQVADSGTFGASGTVAERAEYIEDMVQGIAQLAFGPELERLRDLLHLAAREARRNRRTPVGS
jgi:hypothetical protein